MAGRRAQILVINPNSNDAVTASIAEGAAPLMSADGPEVRFLTLRDGPYGIETQADYESVILPLRRLVQSNNNASAFVIACYSDPGLYVCREATVRPVLGIGEAGLLTALALGERPGVIAVARGSIARHMRALRQIGLLSRVAGERPMDMSVADTTGAAAFKRLVEVGTELKERDNADVIVLGCAGMSRHRRALEGQLKVPVVDPTQAAVAMAIGLVRAHGA